MKFYKRKHPFTGTHYYQQNSSNCLHIGPKLINLLDVTDIHEYLATPDLVEITEVEFLDKALKTLDELFQAFGPTIGTLGMDLDETLLN